MDQVGVGLKLKDGPCLWDNFHGVEFQDGIQVLVIEGTQPAPRQVELS